MKSVLLLFSTPPPNPPQYFSYEHKESKMPKIKLWDWKSAEHLPSVAVAPEFHLVFI